MSFAAARSTLLAVLAALPAARVAAQDPPAPPPPAAASSNAADYRVQLDAARILMRNRSWAKARASWLELARAHAGADYVLPELQEIRLEVRKASFWAQAKAPKLDDLLAGELLSYDPLSGWLKVRYERSSLEDFEVLPGAGTSTFRFPAHFKGPWSIELLGTREEVASAAWMFGTDDGGLGVRFGTRELGDVEYYLHLLYAYGRAGDKELARVEPKPRKHGTKPVTAAVQVGERFLRATYDGVEILEAERDADDFGQLIVAAPGSFGALSIAGKVDSGWLDGVLDTAVAEARRAFDRAWAEPAEFAAWKGASALGPGLGRDEAGNGADASSFAALVAGMRFEFSATRDEHALLDRVLEQATQTREGALRGLQLAANLREKSLQTDFTTYLELVAALELGRHRLAVDRLAELKPAQGKERDARILRAVLLGRAKRHADAASELEALAREFPVQALVHVELVESLLRQARTEEALQAIRRARAALPANPALALLETKVVKARLGPPWKQVFEARGRHFTVRSDVSVRLCREAVRVLDKAMERCVFDFGPVPEARRAPSIAYLFAGQASYLDYVKGIADASGENTSGLYNLLLKQVVAWNQPDVEKLWDTLRHECLHRYVDLRAGDVPRWFNEGLAETFAASSLPDGTWKPGGLRGTWIELLRNGFETGPGLESFARQSEPEFQTDVERSYAYAWTWVHYLRFRDERSRAIFAALWKALEDGEEDALAVDAALARHDTSAVTRDYLKFLAELRAH